MCKVAVGATTTLVPSDRGLLMGASAKCHLSICGALAGSMALLFLPGIASATGNTVPKRIGPVVTIATGPGWSLTGWRNSAHQVCLSDRVPRHRWQTVEFCGPSDTMRTSMWTFLPESSSEVLPVGAVTPNVTRMEARAGHGQATAVAILTAPPALKTHLRFFRVLLPKGSPPLWRVSAYDAHGKQVGLVGQGKP